MSEGDQRFSLEEVDSHITHTVLHNVEDEGHATIDLGLLGSHVLYRIEWKTSDGKVHQTRRAARCHVVEFLKNNRVATSATAYLYREVKMMAVARGTYHCVYVQAPPNFPIYSPEPGGWTFVGGVAGYEGPWLGFDTNGTDMTKDEAEKAVCEAIDAGWNIWGARARKFKG